MVRTCRYASKSEWAVKPELVAHEPTSFVKNSSVMPETHGIESKASRMSPHEHSTFSDTKYEPGTPRPSAPDLHSNQQSWSGFEEPENRRSQGKMLLMTCVAYLVFVLTIAGLFPFKLNELAFPFSSGQYLLHTKANHSRAHRRTDDVQFDSYSLILKGQRIFLQ